MDQLRALWKRLLSYRKKTWTLEDYPIRLYQPARVVGALGKRMRLIPWVAQVISWGLMSGQGNTREEALEDLRRHLEAWRANGGHLPRPGTGAPVEFAASNSVSKYEDIARDFLERILGLNYDECFISDESSLWDFHVGQRNDEYYRKIAIIYGIDVSDVEGATLWKIFERIAQHYGRA